MSCPNESFMRNLYFVISSLFFSLFLLGPANAQVNPSPADIKNVKLGMSLKDASIILKDQGYEISEAGGFHWTVKEKFGGQTIEEKYAHINSTIFATKNDGNELIKLSTTGHPERDNIVLIARVIAYEQGSRPLWSDLSQKISEKHGDPHDSHEYYGGKIKTMPWLVYEYNSKGKKRRRALTKFLNSASSPSSGSIKSQPPCSYPQHKVFDHSKSFVFGQKIDLGGSPTFVLTSDISRAEWSNDFVIGNVRLNTRTDDMFYDKACRTVFSVEGTVDSLSSEIRILRFFMMDHKKIHEDSKALEEYKAEEREKAMESLKIKIEALRNTAPEVDL